MNRSRALTALLLFICGLSLAWTTPSEGRRKSPNANGCSLSQLKNDDPALQDCWRKQDDDFNKNRPFIHVVACVNGHRYCCKRAAGTGRFSDCEMIDRTGPNAGVANPTTLPVDPGSRRYNGPNNPHPPSTSALQLPPGMEDNTDRPGSDFGSFTLPGASPSACQSYCRKDTRCKAWTYVRPRVQGASAVCYLKNAVPAPRSDGCCISGVVPRGPVGIDPTAPPPASQN